MKHLIFSCFIIFFLSPYSLLANNKELPHDGKLAFFHIHFRQYIEITYEKEGQILPAGIKKINYFLRSRDSGKIKKIDLNLIYLVDHLQDYFEVETIYLISGYRSPKFNAYLKSIGRNVSSKSNHMLGKAMDIHFDEISEKTLWNYVKSLMLGGAGYYPDINMVHVDVGNQVKAWTEGEFTNRTDIGFFYDTPKIELRTDRLFYYDKEKINLSFRNKFSEKINPIVILQKFEKGKWKKIKEINFDKKIIKRWINHNPREIYFDLFYGLNQESNVSVDSFKRDTALTLDYGRYRFRIETTKQQKQFSNEFYLKRI